MNNRRSIFTIAAALIAGGLLVASLCLPLWHMRMEAPQYQGSEALKVVVLPGALRGDIHEIKTLNQYIGVTVPDTLPQTDWLPGTLCVLASLGVVAALLPLRSRRFAAFSVAVLLTGSMLLAAGQAQLQMYRIGHDRNRHAALVGVPDFTPPLLGNHKLAQFELESRLGYGSFAIAGAVAIYAAIGFATRERKAAVRHGEEDLLSAWGDTTRGLHDMKGTRLFLFLGLGLLAAVFVIGIYIVPRAQAGGPGTARQSDANRVSISDVYLDVTYATPEFVERVKLEPYLQHYEGRVQPFLVGLNTHVGSIEHLDLRGKVELEDNHGERFPSLGAPVVVSEHHNMFLICFPLLDNEGRPIFSASRDHFRLIFHNIGKTADRTFEWKLPVLEPAPARTLANTLMLALGVIGALMVILSPCAIELTTYYTGIIAGVTSSAAIEQRNTTSPVNVRHRILQNLAGFVAGFTLLYMISGATVAWLGQSLISGNGAIKPLIDAICGPNPNGPLPARLQSAVNSAAAQQATHAGHRNHMSIFGEWGHYANWVGAAFLVFFALKSLGLFKRNATCLLWLNKLGRKIRVGIAAVVGLVSPKRAQVIRQPCLSLREPSNITPLNSFCAGLGLSVSCLTCMGGAILYPMLIFVGTSSWYWGALILGTYSLALAVPMAAIAVSIGDFAWKYARHVWLMRGLQWTSAVVMISVAILVAFERTRFINTVVFTILSAIGGAPHPAVAQL